MARYKAIDTSGPTTETKTYEPPPGGSGLSVTET